MTDEVKQNGETPQDVSSERDLKKALDESLKSGQTLIRLTLQNTASLAALEKMLQQTVESRMRAGALVSVTPQFEGWTVGGLWPMNPDGWLVLLRRATFQGQVAPQVAAAAQQSKLVKG